MLQRLLVAVAAIGAVSACGDEAVSEVVLSRTTVSAGAPAIDIQTTSKQATITASTPVARIVPRRKVTVSQSVTTAPVVVQPVREQPVVTAPSPSPSPSPRPSPKAASVPVGTSSENKSAIASTSPLADLTAHVSATPSPVRSVDLRAVVGRVTTARNVDRLQRPEDESNSFSIGDRIYISVEFRDVRDGAVLGFRWQSLGGCGGEFQTDPRSSIRRGFFAFYIDNAKCPGVYDVDITVDGDVHAAVAFTVNNPD